MKRLNNKGPPSANPVELQSEREKLLKTNLTIRPIWLLLVRREFNHLWKSPGPDKAAYLVDERVLVPGLHRAGPAPAHRVHRLGHVHGARRLELPDGQIARDRRAGAPGARAAVHHRRSAAGAPVHLGPGLHEEREQGAGIGRHALHRPAAVPQVRHVPPQVRLQVLRGHSNGHVRF